MCTRQNYKTPWAVEEWRNYYQIISSLFQGGKREVNRECTPNFRIMTVFFLRYVCYILRLMSITKSYFQNW